MQHPLHPPKETPIPTCLPMAVPSSISSSVRLLFHSRGLWLWRSSLPSYLGVCRCLWAALFLHCWSSLCPSYCSTWQQHGRLTPNSGGLAASAA